ncbi:MAG: UPF0280 family protein [Desulfobulbaceae bacterium]|nr:UPF0280 family protein [Desulfobulbaceae bacterium]
MSHSDRKKKTPESYQERSYRRVEQSGLVSSRVKIMETDLHILASGQVEDEALGLVTDIRRQLEDYIAGHREFLHALAPLPMDGAAPAIIREMLDSGLKANVGPMAAVAGAVAEAVGHSLIGKGVNEVIVENGGDVFIARQQECTVAVYAGESPLSGKVGIKVPAECMPLGVCCSSGTIGHSLSLGVADAAVVTASSTALADAAATRLGNEVVRPSGSLNRALEVARVISGISGAVIISGSQLGAWGDIELVRI